MQAEFALLISCVAAIFGIYSGIVSMRRHVKADSQKENTHLTTVIVKLEGISEGIAEIKTDLSNVKGDIKEITERLIIAEQSLKLAHTRIDQLHERKD